MRCQRVWSRHSRETLVNILWLGKRFYTNKDALREHFGRMYRIPQRWRQTGQRVGVWLVDYHTREINRVDDDGMDVVTAPIFHFESFRQFSRALLTRRSRYIIASGDCYLGLLGWVIARLSGAAFVFDVYDKYDEFGGYRRLWGFGLFSFLLMRADRLLFASQGLATKLGAGLRAPYRVVPNGVDSMLFYSRDMQTSRRELGLPEEPCFVGYFGGMEPDRGVADLLEAVRRIREGGRLIEILLAGHAVPNLSLDAPWIRYFGMVPHKQVPALMSACDVVVVPYRLSPFMDMGASCKIAEYLACQRPLVATKTPNFLANFPDQAAMMGQAMCQSSDPDDMARALTYQLNARTIPPPAENMAWETIADGALRWLQESDLNGAATDSVGVADRIGK
jgi:glycosyltransferase involved in cell wall biosynthesis